MIKNLVSIIMPTYNDAQYLEDAIMDILNQTYEEFELIIVNDGSTDNTSDLLKKYASLDSRIKIYEKENGGTGSALNVGFSHATGEFGTWVSSDDNKEKDYIEVLVKFLKNNRDIECVCSAFDSKFLGKIFKPYIYHDENMIIRDPSGLMNNGLVSEKSFIVDDWAEMNNYQCFLGVCYMFTMRLKRRCGDYITIPGEDYEMAMRMALNSRTGYVDKVLGTHNNPPDSLSMQDRTCVSDANRMARELYASHTTWNLTKIPKIANFYWGSSSMSFMRYMTIKSFKKFNPSWSVHLYVPKKVSNTKTWESVDNWHKQDSSDFSGTKIDYFEKLITEEAIKVIPVDFSNSPLGNDASEAHKSDYLRWNILYQNGGLYSDMDIIYLKSMNEIRQNINPGAKHIESLVCYDPRHGNLPAIGFLATAKGNDFYRKMSLKARKHYNPLNYECIGSRLFSSVAQNLTVMNKEFKFKTDNFHTNEVYMYDFKNLEKVYQGNHFDELKNQSIGLHWYGGHPASQEFNEKLTDSNVAQFNNTLTEAIREVLE